MPPFPNTAPQAGHYWGPNPTNTGWIEIPIPAGMAGAGTQPAPTQTHYYGPNAAQDDWEELPLPAAPAAPAAPVPTAPVPARDWRRLGTIVAVALVLGLLGWLAFGRDSNSNSNARSASSAGATSTAPGATTSSSGTSTGGGSMPSTTTGTAGTGSSGTAACAKGSAASAHGFTAVATLDGPVTDGGSATVQIVICKVSGDAVPMPAIMVGNSWDSQPSTEFASLSLPQGTYNFWDQNRNWFQPGLMASGDSYPIDGTISIPARGTPGAYTFCINLKVAGLSDNPPYDSAGNPIPTWIESVGGPTCWPYTVR